ncbi:MAG: hypothetical protein KatS3mg058_0341 [Roseiflexus sp.]|nr:MAG: hypothetical protein KatS3mg058_0341 [Roseiflexus sp.]
MEDWLNGLGGERFCSFHTGLWYDVCQWLCHQDQRGCTWTSSAKRRPILFAGENHPNRSCRYAPKRGLEREMNPQQPAFAPKTRMLTQQHAVCYIHICAAVKDYFDDS